VTDQGGRPDSGRGTGHGARGTAGTVAHTEQTVPLADRRRSALNRKPIESWLTDMDGVLIHEGTPISGADAFLKRIRESGC
jgi:hypothetical protein